ncbi:MAG: leucyl/phenylalanyl-tRNA--protein transferase [Bacteroidetes bacterium]|nr:leucyl/phenylalanyl-tRNA--protein transferase [Bacteroidota bacterium]
MEEPEITVDLILHAYCKGIFPMADPETGKIDWYQPDPRGIFPIDTYKPKKSLQNILNRGIFEVRFNTSFEQVIRGCAENRETWISEEIISLYTDLFDLGFAHSVETWRDDLLVGGLYGVAIGQAFFGESMFSRESNASKVALHHLILRMKERNFTLLDTQFTTSHLEMLGAIYIPHKEYLKRLTKAVKTPAKFD